MFIVNKTNYPAIVNAINTACSAYWCKPYKEEEYDISQSVEEGNMSIGDIDHLENFLKKLKQDNIEDYKIFLGDIEPNTPTEDRFWSFQETHPKEFALADKLLEWFY